jgi:DNA repair exonuclease SbcCD nuclease subunit
MYFGNDVDTAIVVFAIGTLDHPMKVILISDIHLDTSFGSNGLPTQVGRMLRHSLQRTLLNVVELVKSSRADALFCGGYLYEHERFSPETAAFLRYAFSQLEHIPVYVAPGNHDWYGPQSIYGRWSGLQMCTSSMQTVSRPSSFLMD